MLFVRVVVGVKAALGSPVACQPALDAAQRAACTDQSTIILPANLGAETEKRNCVTLAPQEDLESVRTFVPAKNSSNKKKRGLSRVRFELSAGHRGTLQGSSKPYKLISDPLETSLLPREKPSGFINTTEIVSGHVVNHVAVDLRPKRRRPSCGRPKSAPHPSSKRPEAKVYVRFPPDPNSGVHFTSLPRGHVEIAGHRRSDILKSRTQVERSSHETDIATISSEFSFSRPGFFTAPLKNRSCLFSSILQQRCEAAPSTQSSPSSFLVYAPAAVRRGREHPSKRCDLRHVRPCRGRDQSPRLDEKIEAPPCPTLRVEISNVFLCL